MTMSGHLARVFKLETKNKTWVLRGAIYDREHRVWCMATWGPNGQHKSDAFSLSHAIEGITVKPIKEIPHEP